MRRAVHFASVLMLAATGAFGQTAPTRVLGTYVSATGPSPNGTATISWNRMQNDANPRQTIPAGVRTVNVVNGIIDVSLFPNSAALPAGSCYSVAARLNGINQPAQYWSVPVSASPVIPNLVAGSIPCPPQSTPLVAPGQITDGGASIGQVLTWIGTTWAPGTGGGGGGSPGGTNGQLQYNNLGAFGGFTPGGDCVLVRPNFVCTKTNGVPFAPSATIDTTNASNISSGTLAVARGGTGSGVLTPGSVPFIGSSSVYSQDVGNFYYDPTNHQLCLGCSSFPDGFTKLNITGSSSVDLHVMAATGNFAGELDLISGGGGSSGDHAVISFSKAGTVEFLNTGVWNGAARWAVRDAPAGFVARILLQPTGDFSIGNPSSESDNNAKFSVLSSGSNQTVLIQDQTPTTGVTQIGVLGGAGQGSANLMLMQGSTYQGVWDSQGQYSVGVVGGARKATLVAYGGLGFASDQGIGWKSATSLDSGTTDLGVNRNAAGVLEINNGTPGTYRDLLARDLAIRNAIGSGAFDYGSGTSTRPNLTGVSASIPATCSVGQTYFKTDAVAGANLFGCTSTNTWTLLGTGGGGSGATLQTNSVNNASQTTLNLLNSGAFNGLTFTFTNTTGGNVQAGFSGTLGNGGLTNSSTAVNGQTCTLGGSCTLVLASASFQNQGSATTVLHGNVAGNPSWGAVALGSDVSGTLPVANGGTGAGVFTVGSVVYAGASGVYTQDNARFFWDNTNHRLGIGNASPTQAIDVTGNIKASANFIVTTQAEPTCNSSNEGKLNYLRGGSGAYSQLRVCVVLSDNSFSWIPII